MPSGQMLAHGRWRSPADHWRWLDYVQKLEWLHGHERAAKILLGKDEATNADLAAWRGLGSQPLTKGSGAN